MSERKHTARLAVLVLCLLGAVPAAFAGIHRCTGPDGKTYFSDGACPMEHNTPHATPPPLGPAESFAPPVNEPTTAPASNPTPTAAAPVGEAAPRNQAPAPVMDLPPQSQAVPVDAAASRMEIRDRKKHLVGLVICLLASALMARAGFQVSRLWGVLLVLTPVAALPMLLAYTPVGATWLLLESGPLMKFGFIAITVSTMVAAVFLMFHFWKGLGPFLLWVLGNFISMGMLDRQGWF